MADHLASHIPSLASSCNNQIPTASASHGGASPTRCPVVDNSSSVVVDIPPPIDDGTIPTSNAQGTRSTTSAGSYRARTLDSSRHALVCPTVKQFQRQELGKVVLEFAVSMTMGLVISQQQRLSHLQASAVVLALCVGFVTWWNGMLLHDIYPRVASALEYIGVGTILVAFFGLVISFLLPSLAWAGWLCCGLSCLPALPRLVLPRAVEEASSAGFVVPRAAVEEASSEASSADFVLPRPIEEASSTERLDEGIV